jgi:hypothetical protein
MKFLRPAVPYFLALVNIFFLPLLLAATPFLIAILVWRIKRWHQGKQGMPLAPLPPNPLP